MLFLESTAKSTEAVRSVFEEVVAKVLESPALLQNTQPNVRQGIARLDAPAPPVQQGGGGGGCCA
jgi:hypothetical protein